MKWDDACILKRVRFGCALKNQLEKQLLIACTRDHRAIYVTFFTLAHKNPLHVLNGYVINLWPLLCAPLFIWNIINCFFKQKKNKYVEAHFLPFN